MDMYQVISIGSADYDENGDEIYETTRVEIRLSDGFNWHADFTGSYAECQEYVKANYPEFVEE